MFLSEFIDLCKEYNELSEEAKDLLYDFCLEYNIEEQYEDETVLLEIRSFLENILELVDDLSLEEESYNLKKLIVRKLKQLEDFEEE